MGLSPSLGQRPSGNPGVLSGVRVLLVDDTADDLAALHALLSAAGAHVQTALSVQEALDSFQGAPPDVLVSDLSMPGATGYSLIKRVRGLPNGRDVPAVVVTALAWEDHRATAIQVGFN